MMEEVNHSLFDNLYCPVLIVNESLKVIYCNDAILGLLGVSSRTLRRSNSVLDQIQFDPPMFENVDLKDVILPTPYQEVILESREGTKAKGQVAIQPLGEAPDELGLWLIYIRDVTLEEKLQAKYRKEMQQKQTMIEALAKTSSALNRKLMELSMLLRIANVTSSLGDLGVIIDTIFRELFSFFRFKHSTLFVLSRNGSELRVEAFHSNPQTADVGFGQREILFTVDRSHELISEVLRNEGPLYVRKDYQKPFFENFEKSIGFEVADAVMIPVKSKGRTLGMVMMLGSPEGWVEKPEDLNLMDSIVGQLGIILENSALYESSIRDGLTGLHNVSYFRSVLNSEIKQTLRYGYSLSLILFDIDHFKSFNDKYGHQTGDLVLKEVSRVTQEALRTSDVAARYGGEEFAVICPATDGLGAVKVAERLREAVAANKVMDDGRELSVTISIGVTEVSKEGSSVESLISEADQALYAAKGRGRNQVVFYSMELLQEAQKKAQ